MGPSEGMAEETSDRQTDEIDPNADMAQETSDEKLGWVFDETQKHYPVFYLTDIPDNVRLFLRSKVLSL